jgi:Na+/melibiose symporter-like transporter
MEISPFTVYLWQQADSLISLFQAASVISALASIALIIAVFAVADCSKYSPKEEKDAAESTSKSIFFKGVIPSISLFVLSLTLSFLTPSTKTVAVMYAVPAIVNSKPVQQDLPELYQMGVEVLKAQLAPKLPAKLESPTK